MAAAAAGSITYSARTPITVHGDQRQPRPLFDSLDVGAEFFEMDVHLVGTSLLVAHDREELSEENTLERLYFEPLSRLHQSGSLRGQFSLIIDVKTAASKTFDALDALFQRYDAMLSNKDEEKNVRVIISGNRDRAKIYASRHAFYDGRLGDLDGEIDAKNIPMVSVGWRTLFRSGDTMFRIMWKIERLFACKPSSPGSLRNTLEDKVTPHLTKTVEAGIKFRIWGVPFEGREMWRLLSSIKGAGTSFILNTDHPRELTRFLEDR